MDRLVGCSVSELAPVSPPDETGAAWEAPGLGWVIPGETSEDAAASETVMSKGQR
jgi:hypothetical protein